jgi:hypothetical protein
MADMRRDHECEKCRQPIVPGWSKIRLCNACLAERTLAQSGIDMRKAG